MNLYRPKEKKMVYNFENRIKMTIFVVDKDS